MENIVIYCDGGCRGNQSDRNVGGWGVVLQYKGNTKELYGGALNTTNNVMELTAAIKALEAIKTTHIPVDIHADSAYVVNGMTSWVQGWIKKGWKTAGNKPVKNKELWMRLYELSKMQDTIRFNKVKGHNGVELNERADELANRGMDEAR
ncbi:ribonuclease HI [Terrilactibacillus laevilacticus]|uniref:ribonuclease HI n=1 Tax=Terrilactibacillus laevilacticus TaxID=1380157 RepID=UPI0011463332|nr:ribonuclease HI [Terrilactibacillus laevilacticus]